MSRREIIHIGKGMAARCEETNSQFVAKIQNIINNIYSRSKDLQG